MLYFNKLEIPKLDLTQGEPSLPYSFQKLCALLRSKDPNNVLDEVIPLNMDPNIEVSLELETTKL